MENLNIFIGSIYEQGFICFGCFFKVYIQVVFEYWWYIFDFDEYFVKNEEGEMVLYFVFIIFYKIQGFNEIICYNFYNFVVIRGLFVFGFIIGDVIVVIQEVVVVYLLKGFDIVWEGLLYDEV